MGLSVKQVEHVLPNPSFLRFTCFVIFFFIYQEASKAQDEKAIETYDGTEAWHIICSISYPYAVITSTCVAPDRCLAKFFFFSGVMPVQPPHTVQPCASVALLLQIFS